MPLFDVNLRGRYIKLGSGDGSQRSGFVKLSNILRAMRGNDVQGPHVIIHRRGGGQPLIYRGSNREYVKRQLEREGIGE